MKKIYILFVNILILCTIDAQVPVSQVDSLVNECKRIMKETDNQVLYKVFLDNNGYQEDLNNSFEWSFILYFDKKGILKKTMSVYYREHNESCWIYYNATGVAMFTSFYSCSIDGMYSIERYLDEEGQLLYLNHISKADEPDFISAEYIVNEQIIRRASPIAVFPKIENAFYDDILSSEDFKNKYLEIFDFEGVILKDKVLKPEKVQSVKFTAPLEGDTTSLNQNNVFVFQKPSFNSRIVDKLHIRRDIVILGKKGEWYKISLSNLSKRVEGYIHKDCLSPVEKSYLIK